MEISVDEPKEVKKASKLSILQEAANEIHQEDILDTSIQMLIVADQIATENGLPSPLTSRDNDKTLKSLTPVGNDTLKQVSFSVDQSKPEKENLVNPSSSSNNNNNEGNVPNPIKEAIDDLQSLMQSIREEDDRSKNSRQNQSSQHHQYDEQQSSNHPHENDKAESNHQKGINGHHSHDAIRPNKSEEVLLTKSWKEKYLSKRNRLSHRSEDLSSSPRHSNPNVRAMASTQSILLKSSYDHGVTLKPSIQSLLSKEQEVLFLQMKHIKGRPTVAPSKIGLSSSTTFSRSMAPSSSSSSSAVTVDRRRPEVKAEEKDSKSVASSVFGEDDKDYDSRYYRNNDDNDNDDNDDDDDVSRYSSIMQMVHSKSATDFSQSIKSHQASMNRLSRSSVDMTSRTTNQDIDDKKRRLLNRLFHEADHKKSLPFASYDDEKNCTFHPKIAKYRNAESKSSDNANVKFHDRQDAIEKSRRERQNDAIGMAEYEKLLNKKYCPSCGSKQSYDEFKEKRKKCGICQVEFKSKLAWNTVANKFLSSQKKFVDKLEIKIHKLKDEIEADKRLISVKKFDKTSGKIKEFLDICPSYRDDNKWTTDIQNEFFDRLLEYHKSRENKIKKIEQKIIDEQYPFEPTIGTKSKDGKFKVIGKDRRGKNGGSYSDDDDDDDDEFNDKDYKPSFKHFLMRYYEDLEVRHRDVKKIPYVARSKSSNDEEENDVDGWSRTGSSSKHYY